MFSNSRVHTTQCVLHAFKETVDFMDPFKINFRKVKDFEGNQSRGDGSEIGLTQYSVMQSDRNSFCGDVVLDSFNM